MARLLAFALLLVAAVLRHEPAAASSDDSCDPTWMLAHRERTGCDDMAILQPGNDTRVNLLLLTLDRRGKPTRPQVGGETPDPFAEWPTFAERFAPQPPATESGSDEYADGEGSRCRSNRSGATAFVEQVSKATEIPESERTILTTARQGLAPSCAAAAPTGGAALAKALEPVQSPLGKSFATYLQGAQAFYDGDYDAAKTRFAALTAVKQPWLAETARYMLGRVEVNRAQIDAFDEYGSRTPMPIAPPIIDAADSALHEYLSAYPQGLYAASARGLLRRVYWLGDQPEALAAAYAASLAAVAPSPAGASDIALLDEVDNKLLASGLPSSVIPATDPILLAVDDLRRMRDGGTSISRAQIEAQRSSFASNTALFDYLLAAHDFYVANKPEAVLAAIPAVTPHAPLSHLDFSRQMLRGMALETQAESAAARAHWLALLPAAAQPLQRPAVELALAMHDERTGALDAIFAADSPITNASIREILLRKIADAHLLRRQAKDTTRPQHERDVALYVLLYKELTRGRYDDFVKDVALVRADAPAQGYTGELSVTETPPLGVFTQKTQLGDYDCPPLKETAARLAKTPATPKAQLCLADFLRANGFDMNMLDWQPKEPQLGSTPSRFKGKPYARLEVYKALIANPKTPPDDKAYALYRAVNCYAPAQSNSCGGEDVPQKQRKAWFEELKKRYPKSRWAKELQLYW